MPLYFEINRTINFAMKYGRGRLGFKAVLIGRQWDAIHKCM